MVMRAYHLIVLASLVLTACEEQVNRQLFSEETDLLVVEGVMTNELKSHLVKLSQPYGEMNGRGKAVAGASVYVFEDTTIFALTELPAGSGNYYTPLMRGLFGKRYTLVIQHDGKTFFAQDSPAPVQPLTPLRYHATDKGFLLDMDPQGTDANYVEYNVSWENSTQCTDTDHCSGKVIYYDLKTVDVNEIYKPGKVPFYFPEESIVIRRKYSVSPGYRTFLRSMLSETEWRGGVFDVQRANVTTNLSEGAIGFFAVCTVVSDTTVVK